MVLDTGARGDARNAAGGEEVLETEPEVRRAAGWGVGWAAGWAVDAGADAGAGADFCRLSASEQLSTCLGSQVGSAIHIRVRKFRSGHLLRRYMYERLLRLLRFRGSEVADGLRGAENAEVANGLRGC